MVQDGRHNLIEEELPKNGCIQKLCILWHPKFVWGGVGWEISLLFIFSVLSWFLR